MLIFSSIKRLRKRFFEGPDWIDMTPYLRFKSYKSVTLFLLAWTYAWYIRFLTIPGRMVMTISLAIFTYSLTLVDTPIRLLTLSLLAIFVIDLIVGFIFRPKLVINRKVPERVRVLSPLRVDYYITNKRSLPAMDVSLDSLNQTGGLKFVSEAASTDYIPAKGRVHLTAYFKAEKRGAYTLHSPIADSGFPFSIFKWSCSKRSSRKIIAYPKFDPIYSIDLSRGKRYQKEGMNQVSKVGESMDFFGCREFQTGDDPRYIHWSSTARVGTLIVKEFQEEYLSRVALIVDTYVKGESLINRIMKRKGFHPQFEAAVSLCSAITDFLSREDYVVDIFAAGPNVYHLQSGRSLDNFDHILDILACVEPNYREPIKDLAPHVMEELASIGCVILLVLNWDKERQDFFRKLCDNGVAVKVIVISGSLSLTAPEGAVFLKPEDVLTGEVKKI